MGYWIYALIFVGKFVEITVAMVRMLMTVKGYRKLACVLIIFEVSLWLTLASTVITGISDGFTSGVFSFDTVAKPVAYVAACVFGLYFGMFIEDKMALGLSNIEVVAEFEKAKAIARDLREHDCPVTTYLCKGLEGDKLTLDIKVLRKDVPSVVSFLKKYDGLFVTVSEIKSVSIGRIGIRSNIRI
jgi:uncharacterized protein YebE (UPF0316 family)